MQNRLEKILVIYYSQSGQLKQITEYFAKPFINEKIDVEFYKVQPVNDFPFPWKSSQFFDVMPETVLEVPIEIKEPKLKSDKYDLIIFAYQPWYLSLSLPAVSVLQNKTLKRIFNNTNVITIVGSRNMWYNAHIELKKYFSLLNANHIGNITLRDKNPNLISAITVQYWMFTGKKDKWLGIFPKPGILETDIIKAESFGNLTLQNLKNNHIENIQHDLVKNTAIEFN